MAGRDIDASPMTLTIACTEPGDYALFSCWTRIGAGSVMLIVSRMTISRPTKLIASGLIFAFLLALTFPSLPRARVGQAAATWDAGSYAFLVFLFVPLLCIWFGAGRNKIVERVGWVLLFLLTIGGLLN